MPTTSWHQGLPCICTAKNLLSAFITVRGLMLQMLFTPVLSSACSVSTAQHRDLKNPSIVQLLAAGIRFSRSQRDAGARGRTGKPMLLTPVVAIPRLLALLAVERKC
jgi:hypothetical protein